MRKSSDSVMINGRAIQLATLHYGILWVFTSHIVAVGDELNDRDDTYTVILSSGLTLQVYDEPSLILTGIRRVSGGSTDGVVL